MHIVHVLLVSCSLVTIGAFTATIFLRQVRVRVRVSSNPNPNPNPNPNRDHLPTAVRRCLARGLREKGIDFDGACNMAPTARSPNAPPPNPHPSPQPQPLTPTSNPNAIPTPPPSPWGRVQHARDGLARGRGRRAQLPDGGHLLGLS